MTKITAFIDADILLHRAVSFVDREFDGEPMCDWKQSIWFFDSLFEKWMKEVGKVDDWYLVISPSKNFRHELYEDYKGNRKDIEPHPTFALLKEEIKSRQGTIWEDNLEADDVIGIRCSENPEGTIAVSADKDFATVPCTLLIPTSHGATKPTRKTFSEAEANRNWLIQAMTGDTIDNYKGVPGIGPKKAEKIIPRPAPLPGMWESVRRTFIENRMTEDDAITMARLARILRHGDYDFETKEVKLWHPNQLTEPKGK